MASNVSIAKDGSTVWRAVLKRLKHNTVAHVKRRVWTVESADPEASSDSLWAATPVEIGDLVYRIDDDEVFICSVASASATSAQFIQMHA